MKKYLFILLFSCLSVVALAQDSLAIRLDSLLQHPMFQTSQVGLMVYDLTADSVRYEYNSRQTMRPASTMKVVTAITALDHLGGDYQLRTRLYYTGMLEDGTLHGDIYCVGGFDPMVEPLDIRAFAQSIRDLGVNTFDGNIYADRSMKDALEYGEGWCWDDKNPQLMALSVGRKDNFTDQLMAELRRDSVQMTDCGVGWGRCPETAALLSVQTHSIDQLLQRMMKKSDNFYAEALFYQVAKAVSEHRTARAADACTAVKRLIRRIGLDDKDYRIADGSGLSLYNYVSAELETMLLRYAWQNERIFEHLYPSLPIAGVDGTLEKRMRGTAAQGNVHAKTGTVTGISSLAGYCTTADGHVLAFSIINQGVLNSKPGRDFQDRVCKVLCE
jgi:D-alanyl-D-alanine carboxypeptidase/D-alanyl-D-alanine-endopeptidase (penicillin-binding protein 4)